MLRNLGFSHFFLDFQDFLTKSIPEIQQKITFLRTNISVVLIIICIFIAENQYFIPNRKGCYKIVV